MNEEQNNICIECHKEKIKKIFDVFIDFKSYLNEYQDKFNLQDMTNIESLRGYIQLEGQTIHIPKSVVESIKKFIPIGNLIDAKLQYKQAFQYRYVENNLPLAIKHYRLAAKLNHADAQNQLGIIYRYGIGVEIDYDEARKYFTDAAKQNHLGAIYNLKKFEEDIREDLQEKFIHVLMNN